MKYPITSAVLIFLLCINCERDNNPNKLHSIKKEKISGYVQKGPFINGTSISISELDADLAQTGNTFNSQILNNEGGFELRNLDLSTQFVELRANGFYYNEVIGNTSTAQLTLNAISDITDKNTLNVNILSHLEKGRVEYLISQGELFEDAKKQALSEILSVFSMDSLEMNESEMLNIASEGDQNAILLAISVILQGFRTEAELTELLANISSDIRTDGMLDNENLGSQLINHAKLLNLVAIRNNLTSRYADLNIETNIADFEKYVQIFIDESDYSFSNLIDYPEVSNYGVNILTSDMSEVILYNNYSMAAKLPTGASLKIVLKGGLWFYRSAPNGPINWTISDYDEDKQIQEFKSIKAGEPCDLNIQFGIPEVVNGDTVHVPGDGATDTIIVEYYENMSENPSFTKSVVVKED